MRASSRTDVHVSAPLRMTSATAALVPDCFHPHRNAILCRSVAFSLGQLSVSSPLMTARIASSDGRLPLVVVMSY